MSALTSLLARDGVVPVQAIEDALQRQVLEGGEVDTALLELGAVLENTLNAYRATALRATPASREEVNQASDDALQLLPRALASGHRIVPLERSGGTLTVCAASPLAADALSELEDALGLTIAVKVTVEVRVEAALATFYGIQISDRMRHLAEALDRTDAGALPEVQSLTHHNARDSNRHPRPSDNQVLHIDAALRDAYARERAPLTPSTHPGNERSDIARTTSTGHPPPPRASWGRHSTPPDLHRALQAAGALSTPPAAAAPDDARPSNRRSIVPKGPLTAERARALLDVAQDRDDIVEVFFAFARQYFDCAIFFAVRSERLFALESHGDTARETFDPQGLSVVTGGVVDDVMRSMLPRVAHLDDTAEDHGLVETLGRLRAQPAVLLPLTIRQRIVSMLYGDRSGEPLALEELGEVLGLLPKAVRSLERIIRSRKRASQVADLPHANAPGCELQADRGTIARSIQASAPLPKKGYINDPFLYSQIPEPAEALATLGLARPAPALPDISRWPPQEIASLEHASTVRAAPAASALPTERPEAPRPAARRSARLMAGKPPPGTGTYHALLPGAVDDLSDTTHGAIGLADLPAAEESVDPGHDDAQDAMHADGHVLEADHADQTTDPPGEDFGSALAAPVKAVGAAAQGDVEETAAPMAIISAKPSARVKALDQTLKGPVAPAEIDGTNLGSPQAPTNIVTLRGQQEENAASLVTLPGASPAKGRRKEPSVIVDMTRETERLVDELTRCRPDHEGPIIEALLRLGMAAVPVLAAHFPGPLWFDRQAPLKRLPAGRDISALARGLTAFGPDAAPEVARLITDAEIAEVRFCAALLSTDRVDPLYLTAYKQATFDPDPQVRLIIRDALFNYHGQPGFAELMASLLGIAGDAHAPVSRRLDALEAISAAREPAALDLLISLNNLTDRQLAVPAHRALLWITGHDFGDSLRRWRAFAKAHAKRKRAEWLIDGLTQSDERMRAVAGDELQRLTRQYFGFVATASKRDRERVQRRYRKWWAAEGRG